MSTSVRKQRRRRILVALGAAVIAPATAATPPADKVIPPSKTIDFLVTGIATPSRTATLACFQQAEIVRYLVDEGEWVAAGRPLIEMDEGVAAARAESSRAAAVSDLQIELRRAQMEHAAAERNRVLALAEKNSASVQEVNDAQSNAQITRLQYEIARFERAQAERDHARDVMLLEQLRIRAPFDGYVAQRLKQDGEIVEQREGLLVLVQLDPLEVVVDCPLSLAARVRPGDGYRVRPVDESWTPRVGAVSFASRVADAASQTYRVKLLVDNADGGWMSGIKVVVDFSRPEPPDAAAPVAHAQGRVLPRAIVP